MRNFTLSFISLLIITTPVAAQSFAGYSDVTIVLLSDSTAKSTLISDLLANKPGGLSPIIGSATWIDNGRRVQCRSLLSFNYGPLPKMIRPDMITDARLILSPLELKDQADKNENQALRLTVRRVLQPWEDSATTWENQPASNMADEIRVRVPSKKKDEEVKINVTEMVRKMFRLGNNGFMICYGDSLEMKSDASHWFASAKYNDVSVRPRLLISYFIPNGSDNKNMQALNPRLPLTEKDKQELLEMYTKPGPEVVTPPAPVKEGGNLPAKGN